MKWDLSPETCCKYVHVRSDAASMRHTVSGNRSHFMPLTVNGTAVTLQGKNWTIWKQRILNLLCSRNFSFVRIRIRCATLFEWRYTAQTVWKLNKPSTRRLEREAGRNVELMWLIGRLAPDFKTISDFRKYNAKAIRLVCREFVMICRKLNLFSEAFVAIDGSKFKAVKNRDRNFTRAKLKRRLEDIDKSIDRYLAQIESADRLRASPYHCTWSDECWQWSFTVKKHVGASQRGDSE